MRGAASTVVVDLLPFVKWADKTVPPAELVRFLAAVTAPSSIGGKAIEASVAPAIASWFLRSVPLQVAMVFVCPAICFQSFRAMSSTSTKLRRI
jgi:hypothetical protein